MHLVNVVLFVHILVALCAFACAGLLHTWQLVGRSATSTMTLKAWAPVARRVEPMFPLLALVLFGLGAWLVELSDGEFGWSDGWVLASIAGLAAMELVGGAVLAPSGKRLHEAIEHAADGPVDGQLRLLLLDRAAWSAAAFETATALGIVYLMTSKPSGAASAAIVAGCGLAGALLGYLAAQAPTATPATAPASVPAAAQVGDGQ